MGGEGGPYQRGIGASPNRGDIVGEDFVVLRCVDWLREKGHEVNRELWDGVLDIAQNAKSARTRLRARAMLLDRIDPISRAPAVELSGGTGGITVILRRYAPDPVSEPAPTVRDVTPPPALPAASTNGEMPTVRVRRFTDPA